MIITKTIAGLHFSFAIVQNPELRKQVQKASQGLVTGSNIFGLAAAEAAYRDGQEWLTQVAEYFQANRDYLVQRIQREFPGVRVFIPEGTFLAWLDCRIAGLSNPYQFFLEKRSIG